MKNKQKNEGGWDLIDDFTYKQRNYILHYLGDACGEEDSGCDGDCQFKKRKAGVAAGYTYQTAAGVYSTTPKIQQYIEQEIRRRLPDENTILAQLSNIVFSKNAQPRDQIKAAKELLNTINKHSKHEVTHKFDSAELESLLGLNAVEED